MLRQNSKVRPRIGITYSNEIKVRPYEDAVRASGGDPVTIAPGDKFAIESLDGVVLGGGVDVNPDLYGEARSPETEEPNDSRDRLEQSLLKEALLLGLPVLAICRGMQMLNVAEGGSLKQHIHDHVSRPENKALEAHQVEVEPGSRLASIYGAAKIGVNSRHHQAVGRVAEGLRVTARAHDGTVEAIESTEHPFVIGVQWHPEDMAATDQTQKLLFDKFIQAATRSTDAPASS